ncbi:hypothetical protein J6590_046105 [Homalodisca vitripennis]|nr:hypothetical protein J6590_046105 [Homalodisca vitripennis]
MAERSKSLDFGSELEIAQILLIDRGHTCSLKHANRHTTEGGGATIVGSPGLQEKAVTVYIFDHFL